MVAHVFRGDHTACIRVSIYHVSVKGSACQVIAMQAVCTVPLSGIILLGTHTCKSPFSVLSAAGSYGNLKFRVLFFFLRATKLFSNT